MKIYLPLLLIFSLSAFSPSATAPDGEVFAGTMPCGQLIRPLLHIPADKDCALVECRLTFTQKPAAWHLTAYSRHILPDNNYSQPGVKKEASGTWSVEEKDGGLIYVLRTGKPGERALRFVKLGNDLLHLLDEKGRYMTGDPFQSYTLNRIQ